jgi:hypothetical protein
VSLGFHVGVANLLFWFSVELKLRSFHIEWGIYDAVRAELEKEDEASRFYRPSMTTPPMDIAERFRRAQA